MNLEILPNEILLDLFNYFDGVDLICAFYGLNSRFNFLLYNQSRFYSFKFLFVSKRNFDIICQEHLPFITDKIIALSLSDYKDTPEQINFLFSYIPSFRQFTHLRSLTLFFLHSCQTLMKIVDELHHLCNLTHLNFLYSYFYQNDQVDLQLILNNIWNLPKLTYLNFITRIKEQNTYCIPTKISPNLEYVNMHRYKLKWNQINKLFKCTPRLKRLSIYVTSAVNRAYIPSPLLTLINLNITISYTSGASKVISLLKNTPNLRHLNIILWFKLINGHKWEEIIRNYLPKLKVFKLKMNDSLSADQNIQKRANQLFDSFRGSFWIDEHQWFVRCVICERTIDLSTSPEAYDYNEGKSLDSWRSTYPDDNQQKYYSNITFIFNKTFFDQSFPSDISMPNITYLCIKFPINDQFWSIVPSLKKLISLTISSHNDTFQSQLQTLLDRASGLLCLNIHQDVSLPLQMSLFKYTNASVHQLDLEKCNYCFNEEECITLSHSPLGVQCQVLLIQIKTRESIIILVKNMINLRALHVQCEDEKDSEHIPLIMNDNESHDGKTPNKGEVIQWLKDRLPLTCLIVKDPDSVNRIRIWI